MKIIVAVLALMPVLSGCATERLHVKVVDDEGAPVSNAVVKIGFSTSKVIFGGGHGGKSKVGRAEGHTDLSGWATVKFDCQSSDFGWHAEAPGYYRGKTMREHFEFDEIFVPPVFVKIILREHEKQGEALLYRKKNPRPMYAYTRELEVKSPLANGRYGFDLQCFDWLPPYGKGKVADFYYVRNRPDETNMTVKAKFNQSSYTVFKNGEPGFPKLGEVVGRIEFDEDCGAYIGRKTGCESFPSVYAADLSQEYQKSFPIAITGNGGHTFWLQESDVIGPGEYMVIRSRVKRDEAGNILSQNYSKIIGSFGLSYSVSADEFVFNPDENDTNLEFDPTRNLYQGNKGKGMTP